MTRRFPSARKTALLSAAILGVAVTAASPMGQGQGVTSRNPKDAASGTFAVEPGHTRVLFAVSHLQFTTYYGDFTNVSGTLVLSSKDPASSKLEVQIPVASVSTTNAKLDGELKSADWLDAEKFPAMTYRSTQIAVTGPGSATVAGELTLHGVTKSVPLTVHFNAAGVNPLDNHYTVGFDATGVIKRSDFGVVKYIPYIGDDVTITISAAFEKQS